MKILSFDTSGDFCSVVISQDQKILSMQSDKIKWGHAAALHPLMMSCLHACDLQLSDMDCFAVNTGPGGFTGIRVGVAAAKGLGIASQKPVVGLDGFSVLYEGVINQVKTSKIMLVLESRRPEKFVKIISRQGDVVKEPFSALPTQMASYIDAETSVFGNCTLENIKSDYVEIDIALFPQLAHQRISKDKLDPITPLYIRDPDVSLPKR